MSWDLMLFKIASTPGAATLGSSDDVCGAIRKAWPNTAWGSGGTTGQRFSDGCIFELKFAHVGRGIGPSFRAVDGSDVSEVHVSIHGKGNPFPTIIELCKHTGWTAFDCQTGAFLDLDGPTQSEWEAFQGYASEADESARLRP